MSRPAPISRTADSATCSTTSDRCASDDRSRVERPAPRKASAGSDRAISHAGARPNTTPVSSDSRKAKPSTGSDGAALMGMYRDPRKKTSKIVRVPANATSSPPTPPRIASSTLSVSVCRSSL